MTNLLESGFGDPCVEEIAFRAHISLPSLGQHERLDRKIKLSLTESAWDKKTDLHFLRRDGGLPLPAIY